MNCCQKGALMSSIDNQKIFEQYYQAEYDFNTTALESEDIDGIKELVKEKRVNYALAPIGEKIFEWIAEQNADIHFELVDLDSDKIDGMLYIPRSGLDKAYIILNAKKPLINQIFAAAHEYYHYIKDYAQIKETPYICNFNALENVNEKRASRFAAEFLLPEDALRNEIKTFRKRVNRTEQSKLTFEDYAAISILLTVKYQIPLKAVMYRLYEENYINNIEEYIDNYNFIKDILKEVKIFKRLVEHLYSDKNHHFDVNSLIYRQMKNAYRSGLASRQEIMQDGETLNLDMSMVYDFFDDIKEEDDEEDDTDLIDTVKEIWRE